MSKFMVNLTAINPYDRQRRTPLSGEDFTTNDKVVFAEENDLSLLGVQTIEGFHAMVDNVAQRFVATIPTVQEFVGLYPI